MLYLHFYIISIYLQNYTYNLAYIPIYSNQLPYVINSGTLIPSTFYAAYSNAKKLTYALISQSPGLFNISFLSINLCLYIALTLSENARFSP